MDKDEVVYMYIYTYTMEYYSTTKKDEIMPYVATWMDLNIITQGEVNQTNIIDNAYMLNLKKKKRYK